MDRKPYIITHRLMFDTKAPWLADLWPDAWTWAKGWLDDDELELRAGDEPTMLIEPPKQ